MNEGHRDELGALFEHALALPTDERAAFLDEACGTDAALRGELESLLAVAEEASGFFEALAQDVLAPALIASAAQQEPSEEGGCPDGPTGSVPAHYQLLERLGGGGMGVVYKARDVRLGRLVALKFLPPYLSADEEAKARFTHEARAASALDHPGLAVVHEIGETNPGSDPGRAGQLFIAMAYYEGETLKERLARGPLAVSEALDLAAQIADALAAAHANGIVHRDVKPANVMVTRQGTAKLVDFGAAKVLGTELTREGAVLGTVAYMSPEQTRGDAVDHRTDVWSLGVVLYEMLTGRRPFRGERDATLIHAIRHDTPEPIGRLRPEVPAALAEVVARCLAKAPDRRYPTAAALLADLQSLQAGDAPRLRGGRPGRRGRPAAWYVALAVLGVLILAAAALTLGQRTAERDGATGGDADERLVEHRLAVLPLDDLSPDSDAAYLADGLTDELIARLSALGPLRVTARASAMRYGDTDQSTAEIGRELGVDALLTGSVRRQGERVRLAVQLLEAARGATLWSEAYDVPVRDVEAVPHEITERVADVLDVQPPGLAHSVGRGTEDPEAYERYLRGRYFLNSRDYSVESLRRSKAYFEEALDRDPTYARAWTGLANVYTLLGSFAVLTPEEAHPRARAAAEQALALDDELAEAHVALAATLSDYYWDWEAAGRHFRRAIALDPSYARAHQWYATNVLQPLGRTEEALAETRKAQTLDPLSPVPSYAVGQALYFARRYDEAEAHLQRLRELYPDFPLIYLYLAQIASLQGRHAEAVEAAETAHALYGGEGGLSGPLGYVYARAGRGDEARALLDEIDVLAEGGVAGRRATSFQRAYIHLGLGEHDAALAAFEQAYEDRAMYMSWLGIEPIFDPLRSEPRFQALIEQMGLAE